MKTKIAVSFIAVMATFGIYSLIKKNSKTSIGELQRAVEKGNASIEEIDKTGK